MGGHSSKSKRKFNVTANSYQHQHQQQQEQKQQQEQQQQQQQQQQHSNDEEEPSKPPDQQQLKYKRGSLPVQKTHLVQQGNNLSVTGAAAVGSSGSSRYDQPRYSISPALTPEKNRSSTLDADVQLVLRQLIDRKPKYSLLAQMELNELDDKARFVVFEAACDLLDQAKEIERLREQTRQLRNENHSASPGSASPTPGVAVRRAASIDQLSDPRHRRIASQEVAASIVDEIMHRPPRLSPMRQSLMAASGRRRILSSLAKGYEQLQKTFVEQITQELLSRRSLFKDAIDMRVAVHTALSAMLLAAESMRQQRATELLNFASNQTEAPSKILSTRLQLPTIEANEVKQAADRLLRLAAEFSRVAWRQLLQNQLEQQQLVFLTRLPDKADSFFDDCASWCWQAVCSGVGSLTLSVANGAFDSDLHRAQLGRGNGKHIVACLWPALLCNDTVLCLALVTV